MRRALRVVAASTVLVAAVAAPAQLVPSALAAGGDHGASHEPASGSGSDKKSGGGGVGSTVNKVTCGAQNIVNRVTLGFFGSPCSSSSGSVDPVQATSSILKQTFGGLAVAASPLLTGTLTQVPDYSLRRAAAWSGSSGRPRRSDSPSRRSSSLLASSDSRWPGCRRRVASRGRRG